MEIMSQVNTFEKGMNLDTDISMQPSGSYRLAENVRLVTDNAGTTGILQNIEDVRQYEGGLEPTETILGTAVTRWYNKNKGKVEECGVVITRELWNGNYINNVWTVTDFNTIEPTWTLVVSADMKLKGKISIVTNYESSQVSKIYLSDGSNAIKCLNISEYYGVDKDNYILDTTYFDLVPSATIAPFKFVEYTSGKLPAGSVQYCYQLFNLHGGESSTSALSGVIPIVSNAGNSSKTTKGGLTGDITDKGCLLKATLFNDGRFKRMRIIGIQYTNNTQIPRVYIINELDVPQSNGDIVTFTYNDTGANYVTELSIEEFNDLIPYEFNAKSIAKMDNRLFAANVQEITWDAAYDARAYRCDSNGQVVLKSSTGNDITTTINSIVSVEGEALIPNNHDCINPMNGEITYTDTYAYGYENTNTIRGGRGLNIKYRFVITDFIESDSIPNADAQGKYHTSYDLELNSTARIDNTLKFRCPENGLNVYEYVTDGNSKVRNYADPYYVSNFLGYQRDETYRFGIVLYNKKNIPSPVHWIGDIRFPSADTPGYEPFTCNGTVDGVGRYELVSHPLGIMFEVTGLPTDVVAYEIVRCDRTLSDRTVVTQGLLNKTIAFNNWKGISDTIDNQYSVGVIDRRPTSIPTFCGSSDTYNLLSAESYDGDGEVLVDRVQVNDFDTSGVFDFVSADLCFNKTATESIIKPGMKLIPLYCAHSGTTMNNTRIKAGVPFTKSNNGDDESEEEVYSNPFGLVMKIDDDYSLLDGHSTFMKSGPTGGICKYYNFFSTSYAYMNRDPERTIDTFNIDDACVTTNITPYITDDLKEIKNYVNYVGKYAYINYSMGSYNAYGPHGVNMAIYAPEVYSKFLTGVHTTPVTTYDDALFATNSVIFMNVKRQCAQYGGDTFISRSNSIYISTNSYVKTQYSAYNVPLCFGGDTYLGILDYAHTLLFTRNDVEKHSNRKRYVGCYIPLESSVNLYHRADDHFSSETQGMSANIYYMTEPGALNTKYAQKMPMYAYNAAYSANATAKNCVQKSIYSEDNVKSMNRITCSEAKTNNENIDSWTKFKFANYLDTDSSYGPVTNLKVFKNKLYFFQDSAVGIASVNDRSLIADNNPGALVLGTGGVLTRYDYLITQNGSSIVNDKSITNSEHTLYWHDYDKNVLCALGNGFLELSKVKNVQTYLNRLPDSARRNPVSFYDKKYNEVWFRIYDRCLIYNEQLNAFTSFYTHNPNWFFPFSTRLVTVKNNNCYYLHNMYDVKATRLEERVSYVRFVVNKDYAQTKVFDNQWFTATLSNQWNDDCHDMISEIKFETKTQETEAINHTGVEHREDTYRFAIGREKQDNKNQQEQTNMSYAGRMRGKYLICNYTFDCNDNKEFKLPYIKTTYRYSML